MTDVPPLPTVDELLGRAGRHGLVLTAGDADLDPSGLDFLVVHARDASGDPWILRAPRRPEVFASTQSEARVLRLVRPRLPAEAPDWRVHAPDLIAYPRIAGTPAVTVGAAGPTWHLLDPSAPAEPFLETYAAAIAALQTIPLEQAREAGVRVEPIAETRVDLARAIDATRDALAPTEAVWDRWRRWLDDDALWPAHLALVHGDLHPGHMLLDEEARLVGILDWTDARVTDPSVDLAMFFGCFGRGVTERLIARLARLEVPIAPRLVDHAAERWAAFPALIADWALRAGNDGALEHARALLAAVAASSHHPPTCAPA